MRLEQLYQILEIDKQRSISKAAKTLYMAQSSLSGSLGNLEEEIGVRLFERNASGVTPTQEGQEILQLARQVLEGCNEILSYGQQKCQLQGDVNLYITQAYSFLFSDILVEFKTRFPQANLNFKILTPEEIVETIASGNGNIGLLMWGYLPEQTPDLLKKEGLKFETFHEHSMMLYVSQDNHFAENEEVSLSELKNETFLAYSPSYWAMINRQLHADSEALVMTDREALKRMISIGDGIAVLPETFSLHDLYCHQGLIKLVPIKGSENFGKAMDYLIWPGKRRLTLLEQKTVALLQEILSDIVIE